LLEVLHPSQLLKSSNLKRVEGGRLETLPEVEWVDINLEGQIREISERKERMKG